MERWTPKQERSRDKWRQHLVKFQYTNGLSTEEMTKILEQQAQDNTDILCPVHQPPLTTQLLNSASLVLQYLLPERKDHNKK